MNRHIRSISQRSRLAEFIINESGEMSAQKAAQMGAVLATSMLAGLLMGAKTAESGGGCGRRCPNGNQDCADLGADWWCSNILCSGSCLRYCTLDQNGNC